MSLWKKISFAVLGLVLGAGVAVPAAQADGTLDRILREKKIIVGFSLYQPLIMRDVRTGELSGYFVDALRYICQEIDVKPEFREITFANLVASIQSGEIDLSIADSIITIKRAAAVDFSRPLLFLGNMPVVRKDETRFKTIEDINKPGIKVASLLGGSTQDFIKRFLPNVTPIALNTTNKSAAFMEVASGRADVGFNDVWAARQYVQQDPSTKMMLDQPIDVRPTGWVVKRGNTDLLNFINTSLDVLILSGQLREMAAKYPESGQYIADVTLKPFP